MIHKEKIYIPYLNTERTLHIYLPDQRMQERLPVLYMFDGHNLFFDSDATYGTSWGLKDYLDAHQSQLIVVGIECNHHGNQRIKEFSPYSFICPQLGDIDASGHAFLEWMSHDLKWYIDMHYPTLNTREHTYLGGSSMGGLMALYGGFAFANTFSKAICISCFFDYVFPSLMHNLQSTSSLSNSQFYISYGTLEYDSNKELAQGQENNLRIQKTLKDKGASVFLHCYADGTHCEASWEREIDIFVKELQL